MEELESIVSRRFPRFDYYGSGTMNDKRELLQLVTTVCYDMKRLVKAEDIEAKVDAFCDTIPGGLSLSQSDTVRWIHDTFFVSPEEVSIQPHKTLNPMEAQGEELIKKATMQNLPQSLKHGKSQTDSLTEFAWQIGAQAAVAPSNEFNVLFDKSTAELEEEMKNKTATKELEELKIKTMYNMVEEIVLENSAAGAENKLLFLTNSQASMFTAESMPRVIQALELPEAKFVIRLLTSGSGPDSYRAHTEHAKSCQGEFAGELNSTDANLVEQQLCLLMKDCILPIAMQTNAIILVSAVNDCSLVCAAERVLGPVQKQLGKNCPFTIVGFGLEYEFHAAARSSQTIAGQVKEKSKIWSSKFIQQDRCWEANGLVMQECDLTPIASHYVIFESISKGQQKDSGPAHAFRNMLMEALSNNVPNIAVQTYGIDCGLTILADIARCGLPLLLLDPRERWPTLGANDHVSSQQSSNNYTVKIDTLDTREPRTRTRLAQLSQSMPSGRYDKSSIMAEAQQTFRRHVDVLMQHGKLEEYDAGTIAFLNTVLQKLDTRKNVDAPPARLFEALQEAHEREADMHPGAGQHNAVHQDTANELCTFYFNCCKTTSNAFRSGPDITTFPTAQMSSNGLQLRKCHIQKWINERETEVQDRKDSDEDFQKANDSLNLYDDFLSKVETEGGHKIAMGEWMALNEILRSDNVHSHSLFDIAGVKKVLGHVAKIDRLPERNSLEALLLLRDAWDHVDLYSHIASRYKFMTVVCHVSFLLLGILTVVFTIFGFAHPLGLEDPMLGESDSAYFVLVLALLGSLVSGGAAFFNPAVRWHELRAAALDLESTIWKFRCRALEYREGTKSYSRVAESALQLRLDEVKSQVLESADIRATTFYGKQDTKLFKHDQYPPENSNEPPASTGPSEDKDWHFKPLRPDEYIEHRLNTLVEFYQERLPKYHSALFRCQCVLVLGPVTGAFLAAIAVGSLANLHLVAFSAIVSIITSAVTAWLEFHGTAKKLARYSGIVDSLQKLRLWWQALPEVERASIKNLDHLVGTSEDLVKAEHNAWRASSEAVKILNKQAEEATERLQERAREET